MRALKLAREIEDGVRYYSFSSAVCKHAKWAELKAMGEAALPDLFIHLAETKSPFAMAMISGIKPGVHIPEADRGYVLKMVAHYMKWGKENGFA